jgi:transcription elongation factor
MTTFTASAAQSNSPAVYRENATISRTVLFTPAASASAGDVLQMVRIPQGAVVNQVQVTASLSAGVVTVNIGDGNDTSAYGAAVVLSGAGVQAPTTGMTFRGLGRSYSAEDTIDLVVTAVSTPAAAAQYKLTVNYTCQNDTQG